MFCLDTNAFSVSSTDSKVVRGTAALSSIVLLEMRYGIAESTWRQANAERLSYVQQWPIIVLPFDPEDAGGLRARLEPAGISIGPYDTLIAAQARRRGAVLVTANTREFARVPGLKLEHWARA